MTEHTSTMLELAAIVTPLFCICFGGIIAIYVRLGKIETMLGPIWEWWNNGKKDKHNVNG